MCGYIEPVNAQILTASSVGRRWFVNQAVLGYVKVMFKILYGIGFRLFFKESVTPATWCVLEKCFSFLWHFERNRVSFYLYFG